MITGDKASQLPLVSPDVKQIGPNEGGQLTVWIRVAAGRKKRNESHSRPTTALVLVNSGVCFMSNSTGRHAVQVS